MDFDNEFHKFYLLEKCFNNVTYLYKFYNLYEILVSEYHNITQKVKFKLRNTK